MAKENGNVVEEVKAEQNAGVKTENVSQIMKAMEATEALAAMEGTESAADEEKNRNTKDLRCPQALHQQVRR